MIINLLKHIHDNLIESYYLEIETLLDKREKNILFQLLKIDNNFN